MEIPKFLTSSVDPEKVSLTVKGFLVGMIPLAMILLGMLHSNIGIDDINQLINATTAVVAAAAAFLSAAMMLYGLVRKFLVLSGLIKVSQ